MYLINDISGIKIYNLFLLYYTFYYTFLKFKFKSV